MAFGIVAPLLFTPYFSETAQAQTPLRVMAANTTSSNRQSYDPGEGTHILQGLIPDVVLIQEFNIGNNSDTAIQAWVESTFGPDFEYYREGGVQIPNGIISRFPIVESGEWRDVQVGNRDFAWARIDIPGETDLWTVSVHFLTRNASVRDRQASALRRLVAENVSGSDYLIIGGDFNTSNAGKLALDTLDELVDTDGPYPVDQAGKIGTNASFRHWLNGSEEQVIVNANAAVPLSAESWYVSVNGFIPADYSLSAVVDKCRWVHACLMNRRHSMSPALRSGGILSRLHQTSTVTGSHSYI